MNTINYLIAVGIAILLGACSAAPEDFDIGTAEQEYFGRVTNGYQYGTTTSHARLQCGRTNDAQVCTIPQTKTPTFALSAGIDRPALVRGLFASLDAQLSSWTFTEVSDINDADIIVSDGVPCSGGSSSNNIEAFGCLATTDVGNNLEESATVVGNYTNHSFGVVRIDTTDINSKFSSATSRDRLYVHAAGHGIVAWMGLGSGPDASARRITSRVVDVSGPIVQTLSAGEDCRAEFFDVSAATSDDFYVQLSGAAGLCSGAE
jgi:hypothetical protein